MHYRNFHIIALLIAALTFSSCESPQEKAERILTGQWQVSEMQSMGMSMPTPLIMNFTFEFNEDGTYRIFMKEIDQGTWQISDDGQRLLTTNSTTGQVSEIDIAELSDEQVVFTNNQAPQPVKIVLTRM